MRYILYVRKSTDREDKQIQSLPDQIDVLTKMAVERGYNIVETVEESKSAKNPGRPLFNRMLDDIESGKADAILCWKIDRLNRNPIDGGRIQWMLQQGKLKLIQTYDRSYYPEDNIIILGVESAMANQYIIELRKNTIRGMNKKLKDGWLPSRMPVGYINDPDERTNIPDPLRFDLVRKLWEYMLMGCYSVPQILDIATNDWGLNQRATKKSPVRTLKISGLYKIFRNTFYAGYFVFGGQTYDGSHKAMVTRLEFERVQEILDRKEVNSGSPKHEHAYTGFMRCAECGYHITSEVKRKYNKQSDSLKYYRYYHCTGRGPKCSQVGKLMRVEDLEAQFDEYLSSIQIHPAFKEWGLSRVEQVFKKRADEFIGRLGDLDARITILNQNKNNTLKLLIDETISKSEYEQQKKQIEADLIQAKAQRESLSVSNSSWVKQIEECFDFISSAREYFLKGDMYKKREIAKAIGQNFFVKDRKLIVEPHPWLTPIIKNRDSICLPFTRSEPSKNLSGKALPLPGKECVYPWGPHGESNSGLLDENQLSGPLDDGAENS